MIQYKRNQVEEAISRTMMETSAAPTLAFQSRVKRLLDLDRSTGISAKPGPPNYAFFSTGAPGTGAEVWFSTYDAFAIMTGMQMLEHRWPQGFVVTTLQRIRPELSRCHRWILTQDHAVIFDPELTRRRRENSHHDSGTSIVRYLLIVSDRRAVKPASDSPYALIFEDGNKAFEFQKEQPGRSCTWLELVAPAWKLQDHLSKTQPRQRGRTA